MSKSTTWRREVEKLAAQFGCVVEYGKHIKLKHPSGWFVTTASSPNDPKALRYVESDLKRKARGQWR